MYRTCVIEMSQYGTLTQYCNLTVKDLMSQQLIAHTSEWCRFRVGVPACVEGSIENAWDALKYKGYDEKIYEENIKVLFPTRPIVDVDENKIKAKAITNPIEGIWTDKQNRYTIGIVKDGTKQYGDYIGVILKSASPVWNPGEIKLELREGSGGTGFIGNVYMGNKSKQGTTFSLGSDNTELSYDTRGGNNTTSRALWVKTYPKVSIMSQNDPNFENLTNTVRENAMRVSPDKKYRLAVMPIVQTEAKQYVDKGFGSFITEKITSSLGAIGPNIRLFERSRLDAILHEQALAHNGLFNEEDVKKLGELAPIDYILTGTFTRLDKTITLNARFIDVVTGEVSISFSCNIAMTRDLDALFGDQAN